MTNSKSKSKSTALTNAEVVMEVRENNLYVNHGENVRHYRTMKGYSQEYMATQLKISQPKYSEIERESVIDEKYLIDIAKILNLGIEWLNEIPIHRGTTSYHQDGNGNTNFQNTGDVNYNINNPVEQVKEAYQDTIRIVKESYEKSLSDKNATIKGLTEDRDKLLDKFLAASNSIK